MRSRFLFGVVIVSAAMHPVFSRAQIAVGGWESEPLPIVARGRMENGVNGTIDANDGKTPLMLAAESGDLEVVIYLLERGADASVRNKLGETALDIAKRMRAKEIEEALHRNISLHPPASEYYATNKNPKIAILGGQNQIGAPEYILLSPLQIIVTGDQGKPMPNAPVLFEVNQGDGCLLTSSRSPESTTLILRTNQEGVCSVYFCLPNKVNFQSRIKAKVGREGKAREVIFAATTDDGSSGGSSSPFSPTNVNCSGNSDGSGEVSWTNNNDLEDQRDIRICYKDQNGNWVPLATVPAGTTSYHFPAPK